MRSLSIFQLKGLAHEARLSFGLGAIIGGGAVRDLIFERPLKDIDIFVKPQHDGSGDPKGQRERAMKKFEIDCRRFADMLGLFEDCYSCVVTFHDHTDTESGVDVVYLCKISTTAYPVPLEIVGIEGDPVDDIHDYDFNISQCFVTGRELFMTEAFVLGQKLKTIRYMGGNRDLSSVYRSKRRLARLRAKYPDWTFSNCEYLDQLPEIEPK